MVPVVGFPRSPSYFLSTNLLLIGENVMVFVSAGIVAVKLHYKMSFYRYFTRWKSEIVFTMCFHIFANVQIIKT